jgi:hypothetical protein
VAERRDDPSLVWRETKGRHAPAETVTAHAMTGTRADTTLCGLPAKDAPWVDTGRGRRCDKCLAAAQGQPVRMQEILDAVGVAYHRLNYWTNQGWVKAANPECGSGRERMWPAEEVAVLQLMHIAVQAGVSPEAAARASREGGRLADGVWLVIAREDAQLIPDVDAWQQVELYRPEPREA